MSQTSNLFNKNCPINCCNNCNNRQIGCHSTCQLYNEQKRIRDEMKKNLQKEKKEIENFRDIHSQRAKRISALKKQKLTQNIKKYH